jgi:hypothetical protein
MAAPALNEAEGLWGTMHTRRLDLRSKSGGEENGRGVSKKGLTWGYCYNI